MPYTPFGAPPLEAAALAAYLESELRRISEQFNAVDSVRLTELHAEPDRPRGGDIVFADGTDWNPGSGAGFYGYYGGAWAKLG